jgi:hypothetical protein
MPDGLSDTAIDFYASAFSKEILDTAHPTRFSKERITYSKDIFDGYRGDIWSANRLDEIDGGERLVGGKRIPLARLNDGSRRYGRMLDNMLRPFGRRECKDHYLTTYPDDKPVAFTILDFDRHPPKGRREPLSVESDEWLSIDDAFWDQVSDFHNLATRLDVDVMWVQSPGRWLIDGHHLPCRMFGLYAVVRHEPRTPSELRPMLAAIKGRAGLEVETSWDTRHRNIRIPGQSFMDVCRVDPSRRSITPIRDADVSGERERNMDRLVATVDAYEGLRREGGERLLGEGTRLPGVRSKGGPPPEGAVEGLVTSPSGNGESPASDSLGVGQELTASPFRKTVAVKTRESRSSRKAHHASDITDTARWLREPDTFRVLRDSGLLYRVLREFGWDESRVGKAVEWAAVRLRRLRPASSATCSDDSTLTKFLRKHYLWGCRTYDPAKAKASARLKARIADEGRIAPSLRLADKVLNVYLRNVVGLSARDMNYFIAFRGLERAYAGRVACGALYATFGSQRRFMDFQRRHRLLFIAQAHSQSQGRCRQWSLSPSVVRSVRALMASPVLLFMLCRGNPGKVTYTQTRQRNPQRRWRIPVVHRAREARCALGSVAATLSVRGPPPRAPTSRQNAMFGMPDSATAARRHSHRAFRA